MKYEMTVKEMQKSLARFHDDDIVQLSCGWYRENIFALLSVFDRNGTELAILLEDEEEN